jgi:hypothetical protein
MKIKDIDIFTRHYLIAALWSTNDESTPAGGGEPLDANYVLEDIHPDTVTEAYEDCQDFQQSNDALLLVAYQFYRGNGNANHPDAGSAEACAGHDFWLTRNGHGVGFWDRGMGPVGDRLSEAAQAYGSVDLYVGDNGRIYG